MSVSAPLPSPSVAEISTPQIQPGASVDRTPPQNPPVQDRNNAGTGVGATPPSGQIRQITVPVAEVGTDSTQSSPRSQTGGEIPAAQESPAEKSFGKKIKDNWKEYGLGAPFKAAADALIPDGTKPAREYGFIGWIRFFLALPMTLIGDTLGFLSRTTKNTFTNDIKDLKGSKDETANVPASSSSTTQAPEEEEGPVVPEASRPSTSEMDSQGANSPGDGFEEEQSRDRAAAEAADQ